jgi:hypothetical protein
MASCGWPAAYYTRVKELKWQLELQKYRKREEENRRTRRVIEEQERKERNKIENHQRKLREERENLNRWRRRQEEVEIYLNKTAIVPTPPQVWIPTVYQPHLCGENWEEENWEEDMIN